MSIDSIFRNYIKDYLNLHKTCEEECDGENSSCEKCMIIKAHTNLRQKLKERLLVMDEINSEGKEDISSFLTGSYSRGTLNRPPKDVDSFMVLKKDEYKDFSPFEMLSILYSAIVDIFPDKESKGEIELQSHSITVKISETFSIDVIPALEDGDVYRIPEITDENEENWLISNPKQHAEEVTKVNKKTNGLFIPLVRLIKSWNTDRVRKQIGLIIKSFHLEMMACEIFQTEKINSLTEGLYTFLKYAPEYLESSCLKDPANPANYIDDYLSDDLRQSFLLFVNSESIIAQKAVVLESEAKEDEALSQWKKLFPVDAFASAASKTAAEVVGAAISTGNFYKTSIPSVLSTNSDGNDTYRVPRSSSWGE